VKPAVYTAGLLLAGAVGFVAGRWMGKDEGVRGPSRGEGMEGAARFRVEMDREEFIGLQQRVQRAEALAAENARLATELAALQPEGGRDPAAGADLPRGTRRPDGTIVGGATWSPLTKIMAVGFLDREVMRFFEQADLTEHQRTRLRAEMETRIGGVMQIAADLINGDLSGDDAYAKLADTAAEGRSAVRKVLDEKQYALYERFESGMGDYIRENVVSAEAAGLRQRLSLDAEQERNVARILEARYRRVQDRLGAPIPNMFFKVLRRESDGDIYTETAAEIAGYLRPEQVPLFHEAEANAMPALQEEYRKMLIPKP
jgi:hypothetical protein